MLLNAPEERAANVAVAQVRDRIYLRWRREPGFTVADVLRMLADYPEEKAVEKVSVRPDPHGCGEAACCPERRVVL